MTFQESIRTCFMKYATFTGRASRSEFWWFFLFTIIISLILSKTFRPLSTLFGLGTLVPSIAVGARRLHDTNKSGWWQLIALVPFIGVIVLLVFFAQETAAQDDKIQN